MKASEQSEAWNDGYNTALSVILGMINDDVPLNQIKAGVMLVLGKQAKK